MAPSVPARLPWYSAPMAWAASSMMGRSCRSAMLQSGSISAHWPNRCTGMIARVRGRDLALDLVGIEVVGRGIDVGEHRPGAQPAHGAGRGEEREGGQDDLVAGPDVERAPGPGAARRSRTSSRCRSRRRSSAPLHPRTAATSGPPITWPLRKTAQHHLLELRLEFAVLGLEIAKRNGQRAHTQTPFRVGGLGFVPKVMESARACQGGMGART